MIKKIILVALMILSIYALFGIKYAELVSNMLTERIEKIEEVEKALFNEGS